MAGGGCAPYEQRMDEHPMNIGIIGAGQIGGTLARKLGALGHRVKLANSRGPASLGALAAETGARAATVEDAVRDVALVIVTIPQKNVPQLPKGLFADVPADVVVADTGNYYPSFRDGHIEAIEAGQTETGWVSGILGRPVVKVFNNIMAYSLADGARPKGAPDRIALPVAGDDARAKAVVLGLVDELGFDGVDAGALDESWRQQPGTPVYCTDLGAEGVRRALAMADRVKAPATRDQAIAKMHELPAGTTPRELVRLVRELAGATGL
jgi:8-hydroxy-5-deazaflavin:NADPH oxidoreductase